MYLKRHYDIPDGWEPQRDEQGVLLNAPPVTGISIGHTGTQPEQHFSRGLVDNGITEGWMSLGRGKLLLHTDGEDLEYTIVRMPGTYCCFCDQKLDDDTTGVLPRAHLAQAHAGETSPDPHHPAGYRVTNAYECVLEEEQHAYWQAGAVQERMRGGEAMFTARHKDAQAEAGSARRKRRSAPEDAEAAQ